MNQIIIGDAVEETEKLQRDSIQLVVTSPPYWNIKDYGGGAAQIGWGQTYDSYIRSLENVWAYCYNVLSSGCKLIVNIGDQYCPATSTSPYEIKPIQADIIQSCIRIGYIYLGSIIWRKISTTNTSGGCKLMGSIYYPRDGQVTLEHEYILMFKKPGKSPRPSKEVVEASKLSKEERLNWFRGIWEVKGERQNKGHMATFPLEIPHRLVKMFTFEGETVLDPFAGSGTTLQAAKELQRSCIGIELNPDFKPLILNRLK